MRPRWILINLALLAVAGTFAWNVLQEVSTARSLPPPPPSRATPAPSEAGATGNAPRADQRPQYGVIASKSLFNPNRAEPASGGGRAGAGPAVGKPFLMGVVVNDSHSRAYLEDPTTKKVFGYAVGDQVAGGRLDQIKDDRVVITRPEGTIEVMLRDPSKPRPAPPTPAGPGAPGPAGPPAPVRPPILPGQPRVPGPIPSVQPAPGLPVAPTPPQTTVAPPVVPRTLQQLPPDFLRRRPGGPPEGNAPGS